MIRLAYDVRQVRDRAQRGAAYTASKAKRRPNSTHCSGETVSRMSIVVTVAALLAPAQASAQVLWEAPALMSPVAPAGLSLFFLSPAGGDVGGLATYRGSAGPVGLGFRLGLAEEASGELAVSTGIDVSGFLARGVEGAEVDVMWWSGAGLGIGTETVATIPLGIVVGWSGTGDSVIFSPYAGMHVGLDISTFDNDSVNFDGAFDLGLDIVLESGWMVRFGASMGGDRESIALGVRLP